VQHRAVKTATEDRDVNMGGTENDGHEIAGHEVAGHKSAGQETSSETANV